MLAASPAQANPTEALDEVNAARAQRGLPPFARDEGLTAAALGAASHRAAWRIEGHANDFAFLPPGCAADAAGCAAWPQGMGWGSCCTFDSYSTAGAAYAIGPDGRRYMHLFVRRGPVGGFSLNYQAPACQGAPAVTVRYRESGGRARFRARWR